MIYKIILLVLFTTLLYSSDYEWKASINKKIAFINEAVHLKYVCEFSNDAGLYTIDFNPVRTTDKYDLLLLKEDKNSYEYVAFIKKSGDIDFSFDTIMKKTTIESIAEMTGGLDNEKAKDSFVYEYIKQRTLSLHAKYPEGVEPSEVKLVGNFTLNIKKDEVKKKAFAPYHLEVSINGVGNLQDMQALNFEIAGVKIFTQKPTKNIILTKDGYAGIWSQKFALVSEHNFEIPKFTIKYFDTNTSTIKELTSEALHVEVSAGYKKETLLDLDEKPQEIPYRYIFFILFFIFGFTIGKLKFKKEKPLNKKEVYFNEKVNKTSSLDELLMLLVLQDDIKFKSIILEIEKKELTSLSKAKKLLLV